jgi:hypothetical protein
MRRRLLLILLVGWALSAAPLLCQQLTIQTEAGKRTVLTRSDIEALPHTNVTTGASNTFVGVSVEAVLEKGGVSFGESLRGKRLASCLLVERQTGIEWYSRCLK